MRQFLRLLPGLLVLCEYANAITPAGILHLSTDSNNVTELLVAPSSQSGWGPRLPKNASGPLHDVHLASTDGCSPFPPSAKGAYVVVNRGNCSFLDKAIHASNAGAAALIIRNTREVVYFVDRNRTASGGYSNLSDALSPPPLSFATDCRRGESYIPSLHPTQPWRVSDDSSCAQDPRCTSRICIPTGMQSQALAFQVCCMWDTHLLMGVNATTLKNASLSLPIVFATVGQGENLTRLITTSSSRVQGSLFQRPVPLVEVASIVLWALGILTAIGGAYYTASSERHATLTSKSHAHADDDRHQDDLSDDVLDISFRHAVAFIVFAGLFLTFLYFVHVGPMLSIMFGLSTLSTFTILVTQPIFRTLLCCLRRRYVLRCPSIIGPLPIPDVVAAATTASLVVLWYLNRSEFWYLQDAFGIALSFVFLRTIRLPTLQVASVLLVLAFFYDIFFVFVTPLIFGRSVMVDVATGGQSASSKAGYPGVDFCERYPTLEACVDPEPLPMLLLFPRFHDWRGGQAMLGLGDIVLPGLLLCFALRFDYSREVHHKQADVVLHRYYAVTCVGYCIGLFAANLAVLYMEMGQPALLYLVPCTLGGIAIAASLSGDMHQMWHYGPYPVHPMAPTLHSPMDVEGGCGGGEKAPFL